VSGDIACVIPALDAARTLPDVARVTRATLPTAILIAIDDGSADETAAAAAGGCDRVLRFSHNRGKGAALRAGFAEALALCASVIVTLDADGQHDPREAPTLIAALDDADIVIGSRTRNGSGMPWRRRITNALASAAVTRIVQQEIQDPQSGFRALRREVIERVSASGDRYEFETELLIRAARAGFRVISVPVSTRYGPRSHFRSLGDSARVVRAIWSERGQATP